MGMGSASFDYNAPYPILGPYRTIMSKRYVSDELVMVAYMVLFAMTIGLLMFVCLMA